MTKQLKSGHPSAGRQQKY